MNYWGAEPVLVSIQSGDTTYAGQAVSTYGSSPHDHGYVLFYRGCDPFQLFLWLDGGPRIR